MRKPSLPGYDGSEAWEDKQRAYCDSSARRSLDVDPLDLIAHGDDWPISAVTSEWGVARVASRKRLS
jgi:hypothetical protein